MTKYIFENTDKKQLCDLTEAETKLAIDGVFAGRAELLAGNNWVDKTQHGSVCLTSILRVRKPLGNPNVKSGGHK